MHRLSTRTLPTLGLVAVLAACPLVLAGCGSNNAANDASSAQTTEQASTATDTATTDTDTAATDQNQIDSEAALQIALSDSGLTKDGVTVTKNALTTENGVKVYEVEFSTSDSEHDYTIDAATGQILEKDNETYTATSNGSTTTQEAAGTSANAGTGAIDVNAAKAIAAEDAGFSADKLTFSEAKLDTDDGVQVYEVSFHVNGTEHDYTINAATGAIMHHETDTH